MKITTFNIILLLELNKIILTHLCSDWYNLQYLLSRILSGRNMFQHTAISKYT